jgi:hypothetical protein
MLAVRARSRCGREAAGEDAALLSMNNKAKQSDPDLHCNVTDSSAGVSPAVAGASRPRFGIEIVHR